MSTSVKEILVVLRNLEQENQTLCEFVVHLQTNQGLVFLRCIFEKFDGTRSNF
jgi:hypothetical protein